MTKTIQYGHVNEDTAYVVDDYPYGFRMRTQIRYWIESAPKKGDRFCSQTMNPKTGKWNKAKKSTYSPVMFMTLNSDNDHIGYGSLSTWDKPEELEAKLAKVDMSKVSDLQKLQIRHIKALNETMKHVTFECVSVGTQTIDEKALHDAEQAETKQNINKLYAYNFSKV